MNTNLQQASSSSNSSQLTCIDSNWPISSNTYNQQYTFPIQHSSTGVERYRSSLSSHRSAPYQSNFQAATHHHHHHQYSSLQPPLPPPPMLNYSSLLENNNNEPANRQISSSSSSPPNLNQFSNSTTATTTSTSNIINT
jgi:hypothetical protein